MPHRTLVTEIDEIRSGAWDDKIRASVGLASEQEQESQTKETGNAPELEHGGADEPTGASREEAIVVDPQPVEVKAEAVSALSGRTTTCTDICDRKLKSPATQ